MGVGSVANGEEAEGAVPDDTREDPVLCGVPIAESWDGLSSKDGVGLGRFIAGGVGVRNSECIYSQ